MEEMSCSFGLHFLKVHGLVMVISLRVGASICNAGAAQGKYRKSKNCSQEKDKRMNSWSKEEEQGQPFPYTVTIDPLRTG